MRRRGAALALALAAVGLGCDRVDRFTLEAGEQYCGQITLGGVFRDGLSPRVQMRLGLDVAAAEAGLSGGTISTYDFGLDEGEQRLLDEAVLRPIAPVQHDDLSLLEFGEGRERNFLYAVSAANPEAEGVLAVVSLRSDDRVEVRLLRPGTPEADARARRPLFGLFVLSRQPGPCF